MEGFVKEVGYEITNKGKRYSVYIKVELSKRGFEGAEKEVDKLRKKWLDRKVLIHDVDEPR